MHARIAPLLLRGAWTMSRAPGGHSTIIGGLDGLQGYARKFGLFL